MSKHTLHCVSAFIIGEMKCGTSALMVFLTLHPHVQCPGSELHFFDRILTENWSIANSTQWYIRKMPQSCSKDVTIEKSPSYFRTVGVEIIMYGLNPDARCILVVRDPIQRSISEFYFKHRHYMVAESMSFASAVYDNITGRIRSHSDLIQHSLYSDHMRRWLDIFPRDQLFVLDGDTLRNNNPAKILKEIESFLGIGAYFKEDMFSLNSNKGYFCPVEPGCLPDEKGHQYTPIPPFLINKLKEYFKPHNQEFYALVGHKFEW